jgi:hypothetical protein
MHTEFRIVAIIATYNEADIIGQVVGDLLKQGVEAYVLDNGSTDATPSVLAPYFASGLLRVESFPTQTGGSSGGYEWERILQRKEELAQELDADWFIHQDADEFREGPWSGLDLGASIRKVDSFGYNAIDFDVLNFWPTHDDYDGGTDVREAFPYFEPGLEWDKIQIRCWKKSDTPVDLVSSGGHEAIFSGRHVFPVRFILRHYPIRGQRHAERKIFSERRPRFVDSERKRGWHQQYDRFQEGQSFIRDPASLMRYDPERVRLNLILRHRGVEELEGTPDTQKRLSDQSQRYAARLSHDLDMRNHEVARLARDLDARNHEVERLRQDLDARNHEVERLHQDLDARNHEVERLHQNTQEVTDRLNVMAADLISARAQIHSLYSSMSWRGTAPLRAIHRLIMGRNRHTH